MWKGWNRRVPEPAGRSEQHKSWDPNPQLVEGVRVRVLVGVEANTKKSTFQIGLSHKPQNSTGSLPTSNSFF